MSLSPPSLPLLVRSHFINRFSHFSFSSLFLDWVGHVEYIAIHAAIAYYFPTLLGMNLITYWAFVLSLLIRTVGEHTGYTFPKW